MVGMEKPGSLLQCILQLIVRNCLVDPEELVEVDPVNAPVCLGDDTDVLLEVRGADGCAPDHLEQ